MINPRIPQSRFKFAVIAFEGMFTWFFYANRFECMEMGSFHRIKCGVGYQFAFLACGIGYIIIWYYVANIKIMRRIGWPCRSAGQKYVTVTTLRGCSDTQALKSDHQYSLSCKMFP